MRTLDRGGNVEDDLGSEFPGFQTCAHKDVYVCRRPVSRLQRRAPRPLQVQQRVGGSREIARSLSSSMSSATSSSSSSSSSCYHNKDPIPLLSPLVTPSMLTGAACVSQESTVTSG